MEHISEIIDDILTEWAYQVHDGMLDVNNPLHMAQLEHSLFDLEFPGQFIVEFMSNLREGKFQARSVESGKVVDYKSKESMEKAIKDGRAEPLEKGDKEEPEKETKPPMKIDPNPMGKKDSESESENQIQNSLNDGNLDGIIQSQNDLQEKRDKGDAGAGGPIASQGESIYVKNINDNFNVDE